MSLTPLMNLDLPTVGPGGTAGPQWATKINAALTLLDSHDHTTGKGVKITPAGLNINSDLAIGTSDAPKNLTSVKSLRFVSQSAVLASGDDKSCFYVVDGDLYYNNSSGAAIQLTDDSGINLSSVGSIGGDYSTTAGASVTYNDTSKLYLFKQTAAITADLAGGSVFIYENVASGKYTKLKVPTGLSSNIDLTLPAALPLSTLPVTLTSAGVLATGQIATAQIADLAVTTAKLDNGAVTAAKIPDGGITAVKLAGLKYAVSDECASFTYTNSSQSSTPQVVDELDASIVTTARPVIVELVNTSSGGSVSIGGPDGCTILLYRSTASNFSGEIVVNTLNVTPGEYQLTAIRLHDLSAASTTYYYRIKCLPSVDSNNNSFSISLAKMLVREI